MKDLRDYSLLPHNTFGMDVRAARWVEYASEEELRAFLMQGDTPLPLLPVGSGSNLLFLGDFSGTVLHSAIQGIRVVYENEDEVEVCVGSGVVWDEFVAYAVSRGWYGAENLSLIPGEVGASAVQNIGAYGVEVKDLITKVDTLCIATGEHRRFSNAECRYAYRQSVFKREMKGCYIVTKVFFRLSKKPVWHLDYGNIRAELEKAHAEPTLETLRAVIIRIRKAKLPDPVEVGNAGSFFMNPVIPLAQYEALCVSYPDMPHYPAGEGKVKVPAGWLIDRCGWKGRKQGKVGVHDKQALVLVNLGGATGEEVRRLAEDVADSVKEKFGIVIVPEVNYI